MICLKGQPKIQIDLPLFWRFKDDKRILKQPKFLQSFNNRLGVAFGSIHKENSTFNFLKIFFITNKKKPSRVNKQIKVIDVLPS